MIDNKYLVVKVDDLYLWIDSVVRQMDQSNDKFLYDGYEYGGHGWYFRGQSNSAWEISSSFELCIGSEYKKLADPERELRGKERKSIADFKALTWHRLANPRMSNLEWLMLMQHHGVPTRLVDFTESASVAAYFAVKDSVSDRPFAVWAVNKGAIQSPYQKSFIGKEFPNAYSVFKKFGNKTGAVVNDLSVQDKDVVEYRRALANLKKCNTTFIVEENYNRELAEKLVSADLQKGYDALTVGDILDFHPEYPSERMMSQRGLFMMSEMLSVSFMDALRRGTGIEDGQQPISCRLSELKDLGISIDGAHLIKYEFEAKFQTQMRMLMNFSNCLRSSLFPDVDGVAKNVAAVLRKSLQFDICVRRSKAEPIYASCTAMQGNGVSGCGGVEIVGHSEEVAAQ